MDYKMNISKELGELFKVKTYSEKGYLTSIRYSENYISELLNVENKNNKSKNNLRIIIKR